MNPCFKMGREDRFISVPEKVPGTERYVNTQWWGGDVYDDLATIMHELIHNVTGLTDPDFERAGLGRLSNDLKNKCF